MNGGEGWAFPRAFAGLCWLPRGWQRSSDFPCTKASLGADPAGASEHDPISEGNSSGNHSEEGLLEAAPVGSGILQGRVILHFSNLHQGKSGRIHSGNLGENGKDTQMSLNKLPVLGIIFFSGEQLFPTRHTQGRWKVHNMVCYGKLYHKEILFTLSSAIWSLCPALSPHRLFPRLTPLPKPFFGFPTQAPHFSSILEGLVMNGRK